jgi:hypothetical protein
VFNHNPETFHKTIINHTKNCIEYLSETLLFTMSSTRKVSGKFQVYNISVFRYHDTLGDSLICKGMNHTGRFTECMLNFFRRDRHEVAAARFFHGRLEMLKSFERLMLAPKRAV